MKEKQAALPYKSVVEELKSKVFRPVYLFMGEETYFIDQLSDYLQNNILDEAERSFNQIVFYGKDADVLNIINSARRYPMMAAHNVVIIKEAQTLKGIDQLSHYTEKPMPSTILIIAYKYKSLDKRTQLYKSIAKNGLVFESGKIYDDQVPAWIDKYLKSKGYSIEPNASMLLLEFLGNDLSKIAMELDKLLITIPAGTKNITPQSIETNIGISKEYNNFELQKALIQRNPEKAFRIAFYFGDNQKSSPFVLTIATLFFFFTKLIAFHAVKDSDRNTQTAALKINPYFLNDYVQGYKVYPLQKSLRVISILREYDLKSKGINNTSNSAGDLLKEMIFRILHV
jgi:DNA polymerase III subunit delta